MKNENCNFRVVAGLGSTTPAAECKHCGERFNLVKHVISHGLVSETTIITVQVNGHRYTYCPYCKNKGEPMKMFSTSNLCFGDVVKFDTGVSGLVGFTCGCAERRVFLDTGMNTIIKMGVNCPREGIVEVLRRQSEYTGDRATLVISKAWDIFKYSKECNVQVIFTQEKVELTLEDIAKKFDINVSSIRIKD